jgi:hypothetical protein
VGKQIKKTPSLLESLSRDESEQEGVSLSISRLNNYLFL